MSATGKVVKDPGFLRLWQESDGPEENGDEALPSGLENGQGLVCRELRTEQKFTQPPPRFTEAGLVKALEENGIGRPSTYASIIATLSSRDYAVREKGSFHPTELGKLVTRLLTGSFADLINENYTANLERELDRVAEGEEDWRELVGRFASSFRRDLDQAQESMEQVKGKGLPTDESCPECSSPLVLKFGRFGDFLACSSYPGCDYTRDTGRRARAEQRRGGARVSRVRVADGPEALAIRAVLGLHPVPGVSGHAAHRRQGARQARPTGVACPRPDCGGELYGRRSSRGRTFYGCSRYPKCNFTMWDPPVAVSCPDCGLAVMGLKETKRRGRELVCSDKACGHRMPAPDVAAGDEPAG